MSDFDKFFAEKLDQEAHYPGRAKNWNRLGQRLDAFAEGGSVGNNSHWTQWAWKAATTTLLVTSAVLIWKYAALQKEQEQMRQQQQKLEQQVALLQYAEQMTQPDAPVTSRWEGSGTIGQQTPAPNAAPLFADPKTLAIPSSKPPQPFGNLKSVSNAPAAAPSNIPTSKTTTYTSSGNIAASTISPEKSGDMAHKTPAHKPAGKSAVPQNTDLSAASDLPPATAETPKNDLIGPIAAAPNAPAVADASLEGADNLPAASIPPVSPEKQKDVASADSSAAQQPTATPPTTAPLLAETSAPRDTMAKPPVAATSEQPVIRPLRQRFQMRAGIGALMGWEQPKQQGISLIAGQGISASLSLWRSRFWLTGGVDWLRFEEKATVYQPAFHAFTIPPKSPWGGGGPNPKAHELVQVEAAHRQQRYHFGLRCQLPELLKVRPVLQAAHVWVNNSPKFVQYTYEDNDPGPGPGPGKKLERTTLKEPDYSHSNIWQLGAGLEYDLREAWTLSLRADYQTQAGARANNFDVLFLRAGLEYRIR